MCVGAAAIEVEAEAIGELSNTANVADWNIKAANTRAAPNAWKWIRKVEIRSVIMEAEGKAIARRSAASTYRCCRSDSRCQL